MDRAFSHFEVEHGSAAISRCRDSWEPISPYVTKDHFTR